MAYKSRREKEDARWMFEDEAVRRIMDADGCDQRSAEAQLETLIDDCPVTLRMKPHPLGGGPTSRESVPVEPRQFLRMLVDRHWPCCEAQRSPIQLGDAKTPKVTPSESAESFDLEDWYRNWILRYPTASDENVLAAARQVDPKVTRRQVRKLRANPEGTPRKRGRKPGKTESDIERMSRRIGGIDGELAE